MEIAGQDYADKAIYEKQIEILRRMTGEQRLVRAFELWKTACEISRAGIRAQHPQFSSADVERELARRIWIANGAAKLSVLTWLEQLEKS